VVRGVAAVKRVPDAELDYPGGDGRYYHGGEPFTGVSFTTYPAGELESETEWRDGAEWGRHRKYHPGGSLAEEGEYRAGFREGMWRAWHPNGRPASEEACEFGAALTRRRWDADGNLVEEYRLAEGTPAYRTLQMYRRLYGRSGYLSRPAGGDPDQT
jgi:hypothetical protein